MEFRRFLLFSKSWVGGPEYLDEIGNSSWLPDENIDYQMGVGRAGERERK